MGEEVVFGKASERGRAQTAVRTGVMVFILDGPDVTAVTDMSVLPLMMGWKAQRLRSEGKNRQIRAPPRGKDPWFMPSVHLTPFQINL